MKIEIHTDGGCAPNPGPGGWAYTITAGNKEISGSGFENYTTNNKMEITAIATAFFMCTPNPYM